MSADSGRYGFFILYLNAKVLFLDGNTILPEWTDVNQIGLALARRLCAGAQGFFVAAEATHERHLRNPAEPEHWPAITVNLCFALELSLKAFIALHGGNRETLKKIGHDLNQGLAQAFAVGYEPEHPAVSALIEMLSPFHISHSLRYLEKESAEMPDISNMISIVGLHIEKVILKIETETCV